MTQPLVCMTLKGKTLDENVKLVQKYEKLIDVVELRVDYLNEEEQLYVKRFPSMIMKPCILTIRRDVDGGLFSGGEFSRTILFGRALAFANQDRAKNFAYVDFEDDFHIPSIQDAAQAFGVRIIRSYHSLKEPVLNLKERCDLMRKTGYEIPKIVFNTNKLSDIVNMFEVGQKMNLYDHIFCVGGAEGLPSRILAGLSNSYLTYVSPEETNDSPSPKLDSVDPITMNNLYNFKGINSETKFYGITGCPVFRNNGAEIHNSGYRKSNINAVYIPIHSNLVTESLNFAEKIGMKGMSIISPHKESVIYYIDDQSPEVAQTGYCNCVCRNKDRWIGYNTDVVGFKKALSDFLGNYKLRFKRVSIIGAGCGAKTAAYVLKQLGAKVCIFDRTLAHAKQLADKYGFEYGVLGPENAGLLDEYSTLIVHTTPVGSLNDTSGGPADPMSFYNFRGDELLFDFNVKPSITQVMKRASLAGCRVTNGYRMLEYKNYEQFKLFTGKDFEDNFEDIQTF